MNINEYVAEVLTVLKKDEKLEHVMGSIAGDSDLAAAKDTIQAIEKQVVEERITELTEEYFGNASVPVEGGKAGVKRRWFKRRIGKKTK